MRTHINYLLGLVISALATGLFAAPSVTELTARQRYPWNGLVDISCTAGGVEAGKNKATVTATDLAAGTNVTVATLSVAGVAVTNGAFSLAAGANQILWDAQRDLPKDYHSERMKVDVSVVPYSFSVKFNANGGTGTMANESFEYGTAKALTTNTFTRSGYTFSGWATSASGAVVYTDKQSVSNLSGTDAAIVNLYAVWKQPLYLVVDLSTGPNASKYPVSGLDSVPTGGWSDTYKTTHLVLRKISPGTFTMGDQVHGGAKYTNIKLSKAYYIGVFELTQRQFELLAGWNHSGSFKINYAARPAQRMSYDESRGATLGAKWPGSADVDSNSLAGRLRARTGQKFDLPTEAQWEYACRAGKTTDYNSGKNYTSTTSDPNMAAVGRYWYNGGSGYKNYATPGEAFEKAPLSAGTAKVGSYAANAWGLYDMHGNMWELCRDWYGSLASSKTDPVGPTSGTERVIRGGSWYVDTANQCTAWYRWHCLPSGDSNANGYADFNLGVRFVVTMD